MTALRDLAEEDLNEWILERTWAEKAASEKEPAKPRRRRDGWKAGVRRTRVAKRRVVVEEEAQEEWRREREEGAAAEAIVRDKGVSAATERESEM